MVVLSNRQKKILVKLGDTAQGVRLNALTLGLGISRRTLYREFSDLRLYLH